jgi:hypothetical protein
MQIHDDAFVTIELTDDERASGKLAPERHAAIVESIRERGAAIVTGAVDLAHVDALHAAMAVDLDAASRKPFALEVPGHVQHNPPPRARDLYTDIIANPFAVAVARTLMGRVRLSLYTGNTMLPRTTQQQPLHWDEYQLWPALDHAPPVAALAVNVPLVDVGLENGAMEVWPGTHLDVRSIGLFPKSLQVPDDWIEARRAECPPVRVPLPKGALFMRDLRMWHRGTTNSTDAARPMVAMSYSPWWYRPLAIDFYSDARPIVEQLGVQVTARYRERFDHLEWPPNWELVPAPVD